MKNEKYEDVPVQVLLRSRQRHPYYKSAVLTAVIFAIAISAMTMVYSPHIVWTALLPTVITTLVGSTDATPLALGSSSVESTGNFYPSNPEQYSQGGQHGAVASESAICSLIGRDLLLQGGNAADALVGTTFCVGTTGMYHSGIGGGGFMLVRGPDGQYENIDFRETAPAAAFRDMYQNDTLSSIFGGLASGVPGEVAGLAYLHEKYGKLPWKQVMQGAIEIARDGFPVTADLVRYMAAATAGEKESFLVTDPQWAIDFAPNGTLLGLNDTITRKRLANTLETIANEGASVFYKGEMAAQMVAAVRAANGTMTMSDMSNYSIISREAAHTAYRNYTLHSVSAPASGTVALSILKILEGYSDMGAPGSANISTHRLTEAMRFAYGQRTELGDPSFVPHMSSYEDSMLDPATAAHIRKHGISDTTSFPPSHYNPSGFENPDSHGTSHVVTADGSGLAISMTTTINLLFGSRVMVPETGVIMNNEMDDFSIPGRKNAFGFVPSPNNYIAPFKRPLSSIACTIVEDSATRELRFVSGAAGGSRIISSTLQTLWAVLDRGFDSAQALAMPRLHDQLVPDTVTFEWLFDNATVASMAAKAHNVTWVGPGGSSAQCLRNVSLPGYRYSLSGVELDEISGTWGFEAASEPRQMASGAYVV
ncbi:hypothetical protein AAFC00_003781 [Neodothiora populina]|uniref:Glutathione hydrolase n=1 Tax=Neodothiora populina TaxID=2781224 RepID=A0ABR3PFD0_9PEZI